MTVDLRPDVVVMDLNLPVLNGLEATRRLKSRPETRAIPIIALTAHADAPHRDEALAAGCDAFEEKPWTSPASSRRSERSSPDLAGAGAHPAR
jgi:CheY-like chemotaxis protein